MSTECICVVWLFICVVCRMGFLDDIPVAKKETPIDSLAVYLEKKLAYGKYFIIRCYQYIVLSVNP